VRGIGGDNIYGLLKRVSTPAPYLGKRGKEILGRELENMKGL
jgi:hypothetical protein